MLTVSAKAASVTEVPKLMYNRNTLEEMVLSRVSFHAVYCWRFMGVEVFMVWL